ncbi:hypothetical protein Tco_0695020 [Tanacetum coccineum]
MIVATRSKFPEYVFLKMERVNKGLISGVFFSEVSTLYFSWLRRDKKSVNDFEEEKLNEDDGDSNNSNLKENVDESASFGRFKKSVAPSSRGSFMCLMEEVVKVGQTMGYNMDGVINNLSDIIESQGASIEKDITPKDRKSMRFASNQTDNKSETVSTIANLKKELNQLDAVIDKGTGTEVEAEKRMEVLAALRNIDHIHSMDLAQKAKIKWSIEGDENSNFFHGILNKKRNQMNIRGITIDGVWKEQPNDVKQEFLSHFQDRFAKPSERRANIDMRFPKTIFEDQSQDLEREVSKQEIKTAVWGCGTDKSPGPDGFSFGFYRHFWPVIEHDVYMAVNHFFIHGEIPPGCNSSFIALIPKVPDANLVKDFRPISLIGSIYKIIAKILSNRLVNVLGDIVNEVQSAF